MMARTSRGRGNYAGVCQTPYQFICWNKNDPNYACLSGEKQIPFCELALIAADQVMTGKVADPIGGATQYFTTAIPKLPALGVGGYESNYLHYTWCNECRVVFFTDGVCDPRALGVYRAGRGASAGLV
jgi:hypothetical protein